MSVNSFYGAAVKAHCLNRYAKWFAWLYLIVFLPDYIAFINFKKVLTVLYARRLSKQAQESITNKL
ncbi:hypothetical protein L1278_000594 [Pontibacter sp. HSC-36F09]|nr:hypothetical protein [Pontibacter sp. HSC-36F09]